MTVKEMPIKSQLKEIAERIPENATWEEVMDMIHVRQQVTKGLHDIENGKTYSNDEIKKKFGLQ